MTRPREDEATKHIDDLPTDPISVARDYWGDHTSPDLERFAEFVIDRLAWAAAQATPPPTPASARGEEETAREVAIQIWGHTQVERGEHRNSIIAISAALTQARLAGEKSLRGACETTLDYLTMPTRDFAAKYKLDPRCPQTHTHTTTILRAALRTTPEGDKA